MSSPALHLSSQAFPSPYSQPFALPSAASSSTVAALVSPTRDRFAKKGPAHGSSASISTREISAPAPLAARRDPRTTPAGDHKAAPAPKHRPPPVSTQLANAGPSRTSIDETPARRARAGASSPEVPPSPTPRAGYLASRRAAASAGHLPLAEEGSAASPRPLSPPASPRSPSRTPTHRSASASHLPLSAGPPARRPSVDARASSPTASRAASPTATRPRAASPPQRSYSPTVSRLRSGSVNASTTSLVPSATPEQRELVRQASSLLVKEMLKPPSQVRESGLDQKEYEEVEPRLRNLARLERVWGKSGAGGGGANGGEERERRHFCEALRDGYVLCQCVSFRLRPRAPR